MYNCPHCGRPVAGSARSCGYCGESIVTDYFSREKQDDTYPEVGVPHVAATVLGVFGSGAVLLAMAFQMLLLFGVGGEAPAREAVDALWWVRVLAMSVLSVIFLVQQVIRRGARFSLWFDGIWMFIASCGFTFTLLAYSDGGTSAFYGSMAVAYLLVVGCGVTCLSCVTGFFASK